MTASHFILSAICIGIANTCIDWFIIGFTFHKSQAQTPQTWRPESKSSYMYSTLLSFLFGVLFTFFYLKIGSRYVLPGNVSSGCKLGLICFACFSLVAGINNAIYVNYHKNFVAGTLIASCINYMAAAVIAGMFFNPDENPAMLKISIAQFTPVMGDAQRNLQQITDLLKDIKTDIIVLPELCTTGYSFLNAKEATEAAEGPDGKSVAFFKHLANQHNALVVAGFAEKSGDKVYNSAIIAVPGGSEKIYRKSHLFFREKLCFSDGDSGFFVVPHPFKDCKLGVMICNDWRYPEAARSLALLGADIIACPSNLVSDTWKVVMPARAIENKVFLAVANRCGTETRTLEDGSSQSLTFTGCSVLYNNAGEIMEQAGKTGDHVITLEIDPLLTRDKSFNAFNDLFNDRRPDLYLS